MGARSARPNRERAVLDIEGGAITARDIKAAREVAESAMSDRDFRRLANRIIDEARDSDRSLTRARRDRDRASPRDASHVDSDRLRQALPPPAEFRRTISGRQRKIRSAVKNQVLATAPESQRAAARGLLIDEDASQWNRVNAALHRGAGDVQTLDDGDRATVQRLDRLIQSYERRNDRMHKVYVAVKLPDNQPNVIRVEDMPPSLRPGAVLEFDQFTLARHDLSEAPGHDSYRYVMFEFVTSRGMYLGQSDSGMDTTHVLPRGTSYEVVSAEFVTYQTRPRGFGERLVVQLRER